MNQFVIKEYEAFRSDFGRGLEARDYDRNPVGYCSKPFTLPLIPASEWKDRLEAKKAAKTQLSDIRARGNNGQRIPSTNQGSTNYCWAHSSTSALMLQRAVQGEPHVQLSATSIATQIKNYHDRGGWGSQALEYIASKGVCRLQDWPEGPDGIRQDLNSPSVWETAKNHRHTEWMDLEPFNKAQLVTCLLNNIPVVSDFNWWGHSVCTLDLISIRPFRTLIWNSWGDSWGENGEGILEGRKAVPNGMIAPFVATGD